jgi:hypothetical protein
VLGAEHPPRPSVARADSHRSSRRRTWA